MRNTKIVPLKINGLVAFIDILGYSNMVENNEVETVVNLMANISHEAVREYAAAFRKASQHGPNQVVFSDTILMDVPFEKNVSKDAKTNIAALFLTCCGLVMGRMFEEGLPCRGAITTGEYYIQRRPILLAGNPIIEAKKLADEVPFAGCVLSDEVRKLVNSSTCAKVTFTDWVFEPKTYLKICYGHTPPKTVKEVEQLFARHRKSINCERTTSKIRRTYEFIDFSRKL